VVSSQSGERQDPDDQHSPFDNSNPESELALNARYRLSPDLTTEAAINPDFSQIESDAAQVDVNTTFALYYPERRPFFQEGSDLYNTYIDAIYTRSINDPDFAVKLTGRTNRSSFFYLAARDRTEAPQAKEIFQMLASAEDSHMQKLYQRALSLLGVDSLSPLEELKQKLKADHMEGGIEVNPALTKVNENFVDEMEALEIALEKEYMSNDFYKRAAGLVGNPDARVLLHELALEERNHADILLKQVSENVRQR